MTHSGSSEGTLARSGFQWVATVGHRDDADQRQAAIAAAPIARVGDRGSSAPTPSMARPATLAEAANSATLCSHAVPVNGYPPARWDDQQSRRALSLWLVSYGLDAMPLI